MKCPYRKTTIYIRNLKDRELDGTKEIFEDCEKEVCPFYLEEVEVCLRVEAELKRLKGE